MLGGTGFPAENLEFACKQRGIMVCSAIITSHLWLLNVAGIGGEMVLGNMRNGNGKGRFGAPNSNLFPFADLKFKVKKLYYSVLKTASKFIKVVHAIPK